MLITILKLQLYKLKRNYWPTIFIENQKQFVFKNSNAYKLLKNGKNVFKI